MDGWHSASRAPLLPIHCTHAPAISLRPLQMRVPRSQRGGEIVEPLVREQWFVRMQPLAKPALEVSPCSQLCMPCGFSTGWLIWGLH